MTEREQNRPTPPSEAPGESGDRTARREAEDAVVSGRKNDESDTARRREAEQDRRDTQDGGKPSA
ncbi:hypothetical protein DEJ44_27830 [Streptomyces venezuelae]|uniref:hypothetical protein n=1 Tax=Streptomyces venezuelae TaxID=54571 RepID=UPI00123A889E|nr:hypothetical protein [Streptomyces venezuelae]QES09058.1 hypothetical protein DEJ44_27830 [Streptomyces venezuelae]